MSQEYTLAIVVVIGAGLKLAGIEIENGIIEGLVAGVIGIWIAIRRHAKGDITVAGFRK